MRILCISDTHQKESSIVFPTSLSPLPEPVTSTLFSYSATTAEKLPFDVLVHAGDFTLFGKLKGIFEFNDWLGTIPLPRERKLVVVGNHETSLLKERNFQQALNTFVATTTPSLDASEEADSNPPPHLPVKFFRDPNWPITVSSLREILSNATLLVGEGIEIDGVNFFWYQFLLENNRDQPAIPKHS
eukprot:TRINITY_DN2837_c0_g1_i1.p1 TRINITY_DN2837_c0_g1~~TRINITY_DN2837_c0_g1_i1.p1  ORF type:complete len:187 (-),score=28.65 TRINITY_DN2837_c0_g1_i1:477-1037(-)